MVQVVLTGIHSIWLTTNPTKAVFAISICVRYLADHAANIAISISIPPFSGKNQRLENGHSIAIADILQHRRPVCFNASSDCGLSISLFLCPVGVIARHRLFPDYRWADPPAGYRGEASE